MFTDQEKKIFPYKAKGKDIFGDPVALWRQLSSWCGGEDRINEHIEMVKAGPPEPAEQSAAILRMAVLKTFGLGEPWNAETQQGVMEKEWAGVMNAFLEWMEKNESTVETSQTSAVPSPEAVSAETSATTTTAA